MRPSLRESEHRRIGEFIEHEFGIQMPSAKRALLEGRLSKRLEFYGMGSFDEYFRFITESPEGRDEFLRFTDLVSTHETSFFREAKHFDCLRDQALPQLYSHGRRHLRVLSAACSSGEEAYSLAMCLADAEEKTGRGDLSFEIEGFDLSGRMVDIAARAIYPESRAEKMPEEMLKKWMMRGRKSHEGLCRVVPELRASLSFHTGNMLSDMSLRHRSYDIIFCRNVLIYFSQENRNRVLERLEALLSAGGFLFLGHSESLSGSTLDLERYALSVYRKAGSGE